MKEKTRAEQASQQRENLSRLGHGVLAQIKKNQNPDVALPIRALSNIFFDEKSRIIRLGAKVSHRTYLNTAHTRKFMQTMLVASECKKIMKEGVTTSIRDLYYALKRTIPHTNENTFEEQDESVWPDEPLLVRINGEFKILPGSEVLEFAEKTGRKVYDKEGKIRIVDVDLKVCAFDENQKIAEHKALMVMKHPSKKSIRIKTSSGREVKITPYHSLFTMGEDGKPKSVEVKKLKAGDWVALPRKIEIQTNNERINVLSRLIENAPQNILEKLYLKGDGIGDLLKTIPKEKIKQYAKGRHKNRWSDVIANWRHWKTLPLNFIKESKIDVHHLDNLKISSKGGRHEYNCLISKDGDLGFVLGLLISEGSHCAIMRKREERHISISNKSRKLLEEFSCSFLKSFGCAIPQKKIIKKKDGIYTINIGYNMLGYILEFAFDYRAERAWDKKIPAALLDAPDSCVKSFIRAFRLGDGSVHKQKYRIRFHTTSKNLVNGLSFLLLRLGIFSNIYEYRRNAPNHNAYEVRVESREYVKLLSEITSDFDDFSKGSQISGDRIPNMGTLMHNLRKSCKHLDEKIYKEFGFYGIERGRAVSRPVLEKMVKRIEKFSPDKDILNTVREVVQSDVYWDQIARIEDCGQPPYTIDIAVNPTQNFIGGSGFIILHNSDPIIEDIEATLNTLREKLHLKADRKGYLAGPITMNDSGDLIDCSRMGSSGWAIPSNCEPETIKFENCTAKYVLVVEKDAVWQRLNEDKFWQKQNCIIITGKGQPDRGTRRIVNRLHTEFKLPIYVLTDADPWGYYIYSVIKQGSINLSFLSDRLGTPEAKFIGLTTKDVKTFSIPSNVTIKMNPGDIKRTQEMLNYVWFKPKEWQEELKHMVEVGYKLELEALSAKGIKFISEKYLPEKISKQDFLP